MERRRWSEMKKAESEGNNAPSPRSELYLPTSDGPTESQSWNRLPSPTLSIMHIP